MHIRILPLQARVITDVSKQRTKEGAFFFPQVQCILLSSFNDYSYVRLIFIGLTIEGVPATFFVCVGVNLDWASASGGVRYNDVVNLRSKYM